MKRKTKKFLSVLMCAVMLLTAIPMSAFAVDENAQPYCEIKFKEGCSSELKAGETTEIYLDYYTGEYEEYEIIWTSSKYVCEIEYITDETGLAIGAKITAVKEGMFYPMVRIETKDGTVIANDVVTVTVTDNKAFYERAGEWLKQLPSNIFMSFYVAFMAVGSMILSVEHIPEAIEAWAVEFYDDIKETGLIG